MLNTNFLAESDHSDQSLNAYVSVSDHADQSLNVNVSVSDHADQSLNANFFKINNHADFCLLEPQICKKSVSVSESSHH